MGSVQSSSNLTPPMPPNLMTPAPPPSTPQKLPPEERIENPGSVEELHKKCKGMSLVWCIPHLFAFTIINRFKLL